MAKLFNLARMSTATTGTGPITLGSAVSGYLTFAQAGVANGDIVDYAIKDGSNSEIGAGLYTSSGTTLTRTVTNSTNSNAAINLSGSAEVFISPRAQTITIPIGALQYFPFSSPPAGWLERNGAAILISSYPALAALLYVGNGNNATAEWGYKATSNVNPTANRSTSGTYIVLMDDRGLFERGWDHSAGVDSGRALGSYQADQMQQITGSAASRGFDSSGSGAFAGSFTGSGTSAPAGGGAGNNDGNISFNSANSPGARTGSETRSKNRAYLPCIYAGT